MTELSTRFTALEKIGAKISFLCGVQIREMEVEDLKAKAAELAEDLSEEELEVESFRQHALAVDRALQDSTASSTLSLIYKNKLVEGYPNLTTALKYILPF